MTGGSATAAQRKAGSAITAERDRREVGLEAGWRWLGRNMGWCGLSNFATERTGSNRDIVEKQTRFRVWHGAGCSGGY